MRARSHTFVATLQSVPPDYREKVYRTISEVVWIWHDADRLGAILDDYFLLIPRMCSPPFSFDDYARDPLASFTRLPETAWKRVCDAPDQSFRAMEKASRRENDARMIGLGIWYLAKHLHDLTAQAFQDCPAVLFPLCQGLGLLAQPGVHDDARGVEKQCRHSSATRHSSGPKGCLPWSTTVRKNRRPR